MVTTSEICPGPREKATASNWGGITPRGNQPRSPPSLASAESECSRARSANFAPSRSLRPDLLGLVQLLHDDLRRVHLLGLLLQLGVGVQLGPDLLLGDRHPGVHELVEEPLLDQLGAELGAELVHRLVPLGEERLEFLGRPVGTHALQTLLHLGRWNLQATLRSLLEEEESVHARLEHGMAKRRELIGCGRAGPIGQLERTSRALARIPPG